MGVRYLGASILSSYGDSMLHVAISPWEFVLESFQSVDYYLEVDIYLSSYIFSDIGSDFEEFSTPAAGDKKKIKKKRTSRYHVENGIG